MDLDWAEPYLVDHVYEPTVEFAQNLDKMSRDMLGKPRGRGRTYDQLWNYNFNTVLEWALVDAFPGDFELLNHERFSADVRHLETGQAIDLKRHRHYWWGFNREYTGSLIAAIEARNINCIMTGDYEKKGRLVHCRFKLAINAWSFKDYSPPSKFTENKDAGNHYFDHKSAIRDGKCIAHQGY